MKRYLAEVDADDIETDAALSGVLVAEASDDGGKSWLPMVSATISGGHARPRNPDGSLKAPFGVSFSIIDPETKEAIALDGLHVRSRVEWNKITRFAIGQEIREKGIR